MTEITDEGRQRAADLCNVEPTKGTVWRQEDFLHNALRPAAALARLATRSLTWEQDIAERDARIAELEKAMGEIACNVRVRDTDSMAQINERLAAVLALAAKHAPKPKPDLLEEALLGIVPEIDKEPGETAAQAVARKLRAELTKRGITIPGGGASHAE